jgi:hypothetical protein
LKSEAQNRSIKHPKASSSIFCTGIARKEVELASRHKILLLLLLLLLLLISTWKPCERMLLSERNSDPRLLLFHLCDVFDQLPFAFVHESLRPFVGLFLLLSKLLQLL